MTGKEQSEPSSVIRERVEAGRLVQHARFQTSSKVRCNARMTSRLIKAHCALDSEAEGLMQMAMTELNFSARAYHRILKVARTIADLDGQQTIASHHVAEAIQYRTLDRNLWA